MISGYLINKFRGDVSLFDDGISAIEGFTGWSCFGCRALAQGRSRLPAEDSVALERLVQGQSGRRSRSRCRCCRGSPISTISIRCSAEPDVDLVFVRPGERLPAGCRRW
jgi:adenosylcobyric acid synthase